MLAREEKCAVGNGSIDNYIIPDTYQNLIFLYQVGNIFLEASGHEGGTNGSSPVQTFKLKIYAINSSDSQVEGRVGTNVTVKIKPRESNARNLFGPNSYTYVKKERNTNKKVLRFEDDH
jgi:hypothetical protein